MNPSKPVDKEVVKKYLTDLQSKIVETIEMVDGKNFLNDTWQRKEGGGGTTCIMENGNIFERAGVGFSHVIGSKLPKSATDAHPEVVNRRWEAMGVSLVFHPDNPFIPTVHMNIRFFIASKDGEEDIWWFGGGMDLTPYYPFLEDVTHFHQTIKKATYTSLCFCQHNGACFSLILVLICFSTPLKSVQISFSNGSIPHSFFEGI